MGFGGGDRAAVRTGMPRTFQDTDRMWGSWERPGAAPCFKARVSPESVSGRYSFLYIRGL